MSSVGRALWDLSRPKLLPYVLALPLVGFGWAHWDRAVPLGGWSEVRMLVLVGVSWWLLHSGTLWLNAAVDKDDGEVLMGRSVPAPPGTAMMGYLALGCAVGVGFLAGRVAGATVAACALLAVLYSHPRVLWKGHPVFGPLVNLVGYGLLSPLAGWSVVGVAPNVRTVIVWLAGACGVLGTYFAAQAFQRDEDVARGYRTLVATGGPRAALLGARLGIGLGFAGAFGLALMGWLPQVLVVAPLLWWPVESWLRQWAAVPEGGDQRWANGMARRLLLAAMVGLGLVSADYVRQSAVGIPVAGLGTKGGLPPDLPVTGPLELGCQVPADPNSGSGG